MRQVFPLLLLALTAATACCRVGAGDVAPATLEKERVAKAKQAGVGYSTTTVSPFVIVANDPGTRDLAQETIVWSTQRLRADFFASSPGEPITVWIFSDEASYMSGSSALLGTIPSTPYGFYRPCSRSLIVNAGYGLGTLVHELVHAFIDADFPAAPTWINEGLASLFESSEDKDGHIHGPTNWRLPGLQAAIRNKHTLPFEKLTDGGRSDFDGKDGGLYYAESRYLLYWLQERGELRDFYRAYRSRPNDKGNGLGVLQAITKRAPSEILPEWESFVLGLRYERVKS